LLLLNKKNEPPEINPKRALTILAIISAVEPLLLFCLFLGAFAKRHIRAKRPVFDATALGTKFRSALLAFGAGHFADATNRATTLKITALCHVFSPVNG
jgi:hypothetical protein